MRSTARFLALSAFLWGPICALASGLPQLSPLSGDLVSVSPSAQWDRAGYVEEHYWMSGRADVFVPTSMADSPHGHLDRDNTADVQRRPAVVGERLRSDRPYTTRVIVVRPRSMEAFSGVVVLEPIHPRGDPGVLKRLQSHFIEAGHAWVGVQHPLTSRKLRREDSQRFGKLAFEDVSQLWGMLTDAAQVARTPQLLGAKARRIVMTGYSNSGTIAAIYANSFHDLRGPDGAVLIDGYLPFASGIYNETIGVPVIRVMTQSDFAMYGAIRNRRADSDAPGDRYRLVEVSGSSHGSINETCVLYSLPEDGYENDLPLSIVLAQALQNMLAWIEADVPPPRAPRFETSAEGAALLDTVGNALGGLRLPTVTVPRSQFHVAEPGCELSGYRRALAPERLRSLYPSRAAYAEQVAAAADRLATERWISTADARRLREQAAEASIP